MTATELKYEGPASSKNETGTTAPVPAVTRRTAWTAGLSSTVVAQEKYS